MLKTMLTLMRGSAASAGEALEDRAALLVLDQQIRDVQAGLGRAQRALAVALAEDAQEARRDAEAGMRIGGLEVRARAALMAGREDLAAEAAAAIAALEAECQAGAQARALFAAEIARMRRAVSDGERRLAELVRGRRVARVAEAVRVSRRGRIDPGGPAQCTLPEAEATLARLRDRQAQEASAEDMLDGLVAETAPASVEERLAQAGFGPAVRPDAGSVLARLRLTIGSGEVA